jgi:L-2-hydroxyglutarate oxidase LhgO
MADDFAVDVVVIGAGVVGLAVAACLSAAGRGVVVLEQHDGFGRETSSRNSGVIHAGLQYSPGSLKARLCVRGNQLLYRICAQHAVPHRNTGKLVVAVDEDEVAGLYALQATAERNGVEGLRVIGRAEIARLEPHVHAPAALYVPGTGIVDAHSLGAHFAQRARAHDAELVYRSAVHAIEPLSNGYRVAGVDAMGGTFALRAAVVVNAAGLWADAIASLAGIDIDAAGYRQHFCKGDYFSIAPARTGRVSRLVYPLAATGAEQVGTRIHLTLDLTGRMRLGPDAVWLSDTWREDPHYRVDEVSGELFWQSAHRYLPWLERADLAPEGAGVRPRVSGPGQTPRDFIIQHETARGLPGFVNLIGIESPGLTASPAIAQHVAELVG